MAEKRFIESATQNVDDGKTNYSVYDMKNREYLKMSDEKTTKNLCNLLNELFDSIIEKQIRLNFINEQKNEAVRKALEKNPKIARLERETKQLEPIRKVCEKYNIKLEDLPDVLEEYIAYDNDDDW